MGAEAGGAASEIERLRRETPTRDLILNLTLTLTRALTLAL